ncbi:MAG: low-specificity L-threonine aldolase [Fimbriimonadales bacterium]
MTSNNSFPNATQELVDLRSDTVTRPTESMFEAMLTAPLGDDVLGDDPTVMRLEELAAEITGLEEALFVPSGTMANQIALACHCSRGDAILVEEEAHLVYYEVGAPAVIAGVVSWTLPSNRGVMDPDAIERRILTQNLHTPGTKLLCLENTHNRAGGTIIPLEMMARYRSLATDHGLSIHLDGARIFNAAVALGVPVKEIAQYVDSLNFCLSKGLRSPVGSLLCGKADFIREARHWRKRLGGGMRQAGILAACGLVSLTKMVDRLAEDHARARRLAETINALPGVEVDLETVQTNMVIAQFDQPAVLWQEELRDRFILALPTAPNRMRFVLHADIDDAQLNKAIEEISSIAHRSAGA